MRIFSRTTKVIGLDKDELEALSELVAKARREGKAEVQTGASEYLAIDVSSMYRRISRGEREHMRREAKE